MHDPELSLKYFNSASTILFSSPLNGVAYSSLLKLLAKYIVFSHIDLVLQNMKVQNLKPTIEAFNTLICVYGEYGLVNRTIHLFHTICELRSCFPSVIANNSLFKCLVKNGKVNIARELYDKMFEKHGDDGMNVVVDNYSISNVVKDLCDLGKVEEGRRLIIDRRGKGCVPHVVFYNVIIDGYCKKGDLYGATRAEEFQIVDQLMKEMNVMGLNVNVEVFNNVIDAQYKHGLVEEAAKMMHIFHLI
ncbi:pentatricopeptide repeat-containing protein At1g52620-like [Cicer arietinum]|uniref:pentatricopeptide repeat-containing protein At1g52620-like n=1 Tax=Cicer arietinum TaxID=3827 RepID=UPI003CC5193E